MFGVSWKYDVLWVSGKHDVLGASMKHGVLGCSGKHRALWVLGKHDGFGGSPENADGSSPRNLECNFHHLLFKTVLCVRFVFILNKHPVNISFKEKISSF